MKIFPTTIKRTTVVTGGGGSSTGTWAEDAAIGDDPVVRPILADDTAIDDALARAATVVADDTTVSDDFTAVATPAFSEDATVGDDPVARTILADDTAIDDAFAVLVTRLDEDATLADDLAVFSRLAEDTAVNDLAKARCIVTDTGRSGTPASDLAQETDVDQALATTNTGNAATFRARSANALGNLQLIGFVEIDLTRFASMVAQSTATPFTFTFKVSHNGVAAATINWDLRRHTAKPFVEDTVTWNTKPASTLGTSVTTGAPSIPTGGGLTTVTVTMTEAQFNSSLTDGWLFLVVTDDDTVLTPLFTCQSREAATAADRPQLDLLLQRGT